MLKSTGVTQKQNLGMLPLTVEQARERLHFQRVKTNAFRALNEEGRRELLSAIEFGHTSVVIGNKNFNLRYEPDDRVWFSPVEGLLPCGRIWIRELQNEFITG